MSDEFDADGALLALTQGLDGSSLHDVGSRATYWAGTAFVPVELWTPEGWEDTVSTEPLDKHTTAYLPMGHQPCGDNLLEWGNALWVRARLPVALGFAPPTCRHSLRWVFLDAALMAVTVANERVRFTPFFCTDRDSTLEAELQFGKGCEASRRREVATAFWALLASAPDALANYRDRFMSLDGHDYGPTLAGYWRGLFHSQTCQR